MHSLEDLSKKIEEGLQNLPLKKSPQKLYDPIIYTLQMGGKRMRPALCLMACDLFGGEVSEALKPALGIEVFHNFTLLHDDIMDKAPLRRGKDTVHIKWDDNTAILSGDTMMALSYEYVMQAPKHCRNEVFRLFNKTAIEVCEGQQFDMNFETKELVILDEYIEMIRLKTAVLLAASLKIGAIIAGADQKKADALYQFGINTGIAFQLKDDLLDTFGEGDKFGKTIGGDIAANKKTFLIIKALELANTTQRKQLLDFYNSHKIDNLKKIKAVINLFEALNIQAVTQEKINNYYEMALADLEKLELSKPQLQPLLLFADKLKKREN